MSPTYITLGGERYLVNFEADKGEIVASCFPKEADDHIYGFGPTWQAALEDLESSYKDLIDFINSDSYF